MTPLVHALARELMKPVSRQQVHGPREIAEKLLDAHCFEITEIAHAFNDHAFNTHDVMQAETNFSPADVCVFDSREEPTNANVGCLRGGFYTLGEGRDYALGAIQQFDNGDIRIVPMGFIRNAGSTDALIEVAEQTPGLSVEFRDKSIGSFALLAEAHACVSGGFLSLVNTPGLVGHEQQHAHKGLVKNLKRARPAYAAKPWTKISLGRSHGESADIERFGGKRCFHFVRAFIRNRRGKQELVRSHWRGDAAREFRTGNYEITA